MYMMKQVKVVIQILTAQFPVNFLQSLKFKLLYFSHVISPLDTLTRKLNTGILRKLANIARLLVWLILVRCLVLSVVSDNCIEFYLGYKIGEWRQLLMITILTSIHLFFVQNEMYWAHSEAYVKLSWLQPFQMLGGLRTPAWFMLSDQLYSRLVTRSRRVFVGSLIAVVIRVLFGVWLLTKLYSYDNFGRVGGDPYTGLVWIGILSVFLYLQSTALYMTTACFLVLCHYFEMQFQRMHMLAKRMADPLLVLEEEQIQTLIIRVYHEHETLCKQLNNYNHFWSRWILWSYIGLPSVVLYCLYQAVFVPQTKLVILLM